MNDTGVTVGDRCNPAAAVIEKFGGVRALARELGLDPSSLSKWQRIDRGSGGLIPSRHHLALLALAKKKKIALTADEIIGA